MRDKSVNVKREQITTEPALAVSSPKGKDIDRAAKLERQKQFDEFARELSYWRKKNRYYYAQQRVYFCSLVPEGQKVLELGCEDGNLLASLKPSRGLGIHFSPGMIELARKCHCDNPHLEFRVADIECLDIEEVFDVVILADVVGYLLDVEETLRAIRKVCAPHTRVIISYYNFLWEPVLKLGEKFRLKRPQKELNWLSSSDLHNLLFLAGFEVVKTERRVLLPKGVPLLSALCNRYLASLPGIAHLCLSFYLVARITEERPFKEDYSTTIVVPTQNERGNIEQLVKRLPSFGGRQEIIFVDGHSTDGTPEEIQRVIKAYPNRTIKYLIQDGVGKGDAVRKGFAHATGDILMILDADLTVPPEDLPKFYRAIASGRGEFINGSRLVYPMERQAMRFLNLVGNKFFSWGFTWLLNQRLKDTLCGTKVMFRKDYERLVANRDYFGDFDPFGDFDLIFGASRLNLRIVEVPIRYRERTYGATKISRFKHGWLLLRMFLFALRKLKMV